MTALDLLAAALMLVGGFFFLAGTVGLLRFPDVCARLHALTKADNLGLGFVVAGLAVESGSLAVAAKLVVVWALVLGSSSIACQLIAGVARRDDSDEERA